MGAAGGGGAGPCSCRLSSPLAGWGQPQPGHLPPPWGQGRAKAGPGYHPTGLVRGMRVGHRLRMGGQGPRTRLGRGQARPPACKLGLGSGSAGPTAGPGLAAMWRPSQGPSGASAESSSHGPGISSVHGLPATHPGASPQRHSKMGHLWLCQL